MQTYAEQAVQRQMEKEIQPKMDAQFRATKTLFVDADKEERDRIMRHAVRYSDRYLSLIHILSMISTTLSISVWPCMNR